MAAAKPDREYAVLVRPFVNLVDDLIHQHSKSLRLVPAPLGNQRLIQGQFVRQIHLENLSGRFAIRPADFNLAIDASRTQDRRVDQVRPIRRENDHDIPQRFNPVHLGTEHRNQRAGNIERARRPSGPQNRLRFVDENKRERAFAPAGSGLGKEIAHHALRLAEPHIQNLRPFDMEKRPARDGRQRLRFTGGGHRLAHKLRQTGGRGLTDQCFSAARRTVEQKAFRLRELELLKRLRMQQRIFDRLANCADRFLLAADLLPGNSRHFVEDMRLGLTIFQLFDRDPVPRIDPQFIAGLQLHSDKVARALEDHRLSPHLLLETQPPVRQCFRQLQHRPVQVIAQRLDDRIGFVH